MGNSQPTWAWVTLGPIEPPSDRNMIWCRLLNGLRSDPSGARLDFRPVQNINTPSYVHCCFWASHVSPPCL